MYGSLKNFLPQHETDWMHTRLGDVYFLAKNYQQALHHYNTALG
jgi:hypothetical protein